MSKFRRYRLNPETLLYEIEKVPAKSRAIGMLTLVLASAALSAVCLLLVTSVFGVELPKTAMLRRTNAKWASRMSILNRRLDTYDAALEGLGIRDDEIYRNIFGMNDIPDEVRNAGFGGVNRYEFLDNMTGAAELKNTLVRLDVLTKKSYVQSKSYDEVEAVSGKAGDMASCIPAIPPVLPDESKYRVSSKFGYRTDPINGGSKMHTGFDFSCKPGNPVYATGDGVVETVRYELFGYGNSVLVDHGFGYKTRYAHLKSAYVTEGMKVRRGECIGESGNSGRSTGPHLHYEVMYKGKYVNPYNYFDLTMPLDEYKDLITKTAGESDNIMTARFRSGGKSRR